MKLNQIFSIIFLTVANYSCNTHNAKAPEEKITTSEISQDSSTLSIPIDISNAFIRHKIMTSVSFPLVEETKIVKVPVFNPVTVPELVITKVTRQIACDVIEKVKIGGGWKCVVCPVCCLADVVVHKMCDITEDVQNWVDKEIIKQINLDVPVYYKAILNDIRFEGNNDVLFTHVKLDFALKADVDTKIIKTLVASCGINEQMPQIELILSSKLNFGDSGSIVITDKNWEIKWNNACNLTALNIKVEDLLNLPFVKNLIENKIDELVQTKIPNEVGLKDKLEKIWPKISTPVKIGNFGYINFNVSQLSTNNLFATVDNIKTEIGATCTPKIILTDKPISTKPLPFPKINKKQADKGFNINLLAAVSIDKINDYVKSVFNDYKETVENKEIKINTIKFYQSDTNLVVQVSLNKPFKGKVYFWGKPKFDTLNNILSIENLNYTVESIAIIKEFANWLTHINAIEKIIKSKFKYKYDKNITEIIKSLNDINQPIAENIFLKGKLDKVSPTTIAISDNAINILINLKGNAFIEIR